LRYGLQRAFGLTRSQASRCLGARFMATQKVTSQVVPQSDKFQDIKTIKSRLLEDIDAEIEDISKVTRRDEIQNSLKAMAATLTQIEVEQVKNFVLKLSKNNYDVEVKWSPLDVAEEEDDAAPPDLDEEKGEDQQEDQQEAQQNQESGPTPHNIVVTLTPKGTKNSVRLGCIATSDFDLRVEGIDLSNDQGEFNNNDEEGLFFHELSSDVQDGIYDLLHTLNIDDRTATLVHHQNEQHTNDRIHRGFKKLGEFLKN